MRILVLQHAIEEHPGAFRTLLEEDGHEWVPVELDHGEPLPALDGFDALWVMGGPMDVWEEEQHPWLVAEKAFIREAVAERGLPYLGVCLGHQLLADALGGEVGKGEPEVGVLEVQQTEYGAESIFLDAVPVISRALQWHGAEVKRLPEGAKVLATSPACAVQAMSWGPRALGLQYHVEVEPDTVSKWAAIPEYAAALDKVFGEGGVDKLAAACAEHIDAMNAVTERIYINWLQAAAQPLPPR